MTMVRWRQMLGGLALMTMMMTGASLQAQWTQTNGPTGAALSGVAAEGAERLVLIDDEVHRLVEGEWKRVGTLPQVDEATRSRGDARMMTILDGVLLVQHRGHLLRSTDYGRSFTNVGLASAVFTDGETFYTLTDDPAFREMPAIARSTDGGETFEKTGELPHSSSTPVVYDGALYSAFGYGMTMFRSDDGGENWDTLDMELSFTGRETSAGAQFSKGLVATPSGLFMKVGADVFRSTDGETWRNVTGNLPEPMTIDRIDASDDHVYIVTQMNEAFRYDIDEDSWTKLDVDLVRSVLPTDQGVIVQSVTGGLIEIAATASEGTDLLGGLVRSRVYTMGAVNDVVLTSADGYVYRTEDGGTSWERVEAIEGWSIVTFCTNESTGEVYILDGSSQFGVPLRSSDEGKTWEEFGPVYEWDPTWRRADVHTIVATDDGIFAAISGYGPSKANGGWRAGGVYRSIDGGETWQKVDNGLPYNVETTVPIASMIAVDNVLLVTTPAGTFRSQNGGGNWVPAMNGVSAEDREKPGGALFAIGSTVFKKTSNGFYESDDYGKSWTAIELDLPTGLEYTYNLFSLDGEIYMQSYRPGTGSPLGYFDYHLVKFDGTEWKDITDWQPEGVIFTDMVRAGDMYYAGTQKHGVWSLSRDFSIGSASVDEDRPAPARLDLSVAPNPADDRIGLTLNVPERTTLDLSLVDPLGQVVRHLYSGAISAGTETLEVTTAELTAGTWYIRSVQADGTTTLLPVQIIR